MTLLENLCLYIVGSILELYSLTGLEIWQQHKASVWQKPYPVTTRQFWQFDRKLFLHTSALSKNHALPHHRFRARTYVSLGDYYYHQKVNRWFPVHDSWHCLDHLWFEWIQQLTAAVTLDYSYSASYVLLKTFILNRPTFYFYLSNFYSLLVLSLK